MFQALLARLRRSSAERDSQEARNWYDTCQEVARLCHESLANDQVGGTDIGAVIDRMDRKLFTLHDHAAVTRRLLRRTNKPTLARDVAKASETVYRLRNKTTLFLIESQGPAPDLGTTPEETQANYLHAMDSHGQDAKLIHLDVIRDLDRIWSELRLVLTPRSHEE
jgi:hypothetical protein